MPPALLCPSRDDASPRREIGSFSRGFDGTCWGNLQGPETTLVLRGDVNPQAELGGDSQISAESETVQSPSDYLCPYWQVFLDRLIWSSGYYDKLLIQHGTRNQPHVEPVLQLGHRKRLKRSRIHFFLIICECKAKEFQSSHQWTRANPEVPLATVSGFIFREPLALGFHYHFKTKPP